MNLSRSMIEVGNRAISVDTDVPTAKMIVATISNVNKLFLVGQDFYKLHYIATKPSTLPIIYLNVGGTDNTEQSK